MLHCFKFLRRVTIRRNRPFPGTSSDVWESETKQEGGGKIASGFVLIMKTTWEGKIFVAFLAALAIE